MRVIVTGSRDWTDRITIARALHEYVVEKHWETGYDGQGEFVDYLVPKDFVLVHGHCPTGADAIADDWCIGYDFIAERHPAEWNSYGKAAGRMRNYDMAQLGADLCLAFLKNESPGTRDMINKAIKAKIRTVIYPI
jgi:hypothetical protein